MKAQPPLKADFSFIRYGQVWEDADVLLEALDIHPEDHCLSIASAGDNVLALLNKNPARVVAIDLNPAQIACLELRVAAYRTLQHHELLHLIGTQPHSKQTPHSSSSMTDRMTLYRRCRSSLSPNAKEFWDRHPREINRGIGSAGKFERYFEIFRKWILPLIHSHKSIQYLLQIESREERRAFYEEHCHTTRWRFLFKLFFSRRIMSWLGRDPQFFRFVNGGVAERLLHCTEHALTELSPSQNPYLQWILCGSYQTALPYALRPENFEAIRRNLDRLEWRQQSLEDFLNATQGPFFTKYNLSDIFEYMDEEAYHSLLERLLAISPPRARLVYWNLLVPRRRPESMTDRLRPQTDLASRLHLQDKAFFYAALNIEDVTTPS